MPRLRVAPRKKRIERSNEKRQTVDSCNRGELHESGICRRWIAKQVPRKTDFWKPVANHFERNPQERRTDACECDAAERKTLDGPCDRSVYRTPNRGNQQ